MILAILEKLGDLFQRMHQTLVNWEMRWRFRNFKPQINDRKLELDEIDMGNMGRWQASDDQRLPPAHTTVNVGAYNWTEAKKK